jgi:predicted Zn-ribbon and HTH transcriptional regulator
MWCPRCKSTRIQRGYKNSSLVLQMAGLHELLCNNCGLEFKGFDPLRKLERKPAARQKVAVNTRRFARYKVHLPATIALVERNALSWDVSYSKPARGHCETISQGGMALSFVGSRMAEQQLTRPGCPLYVTVNLTSGVIAAVLSTVSCDRLGANGQATWFLGAKITQMSDADAARLAEYLEKRAQAEPFLALT